TSSVVTVSLSAGQQFILSKDSMADHRILPNASQIKACKIELQVGKSAGVMHLRSDKKWMFQRTEEAGATQGYVVTENKIESLLYALSAIESKSSITSGSVTVERADIEHPSIRLGIWESPESLAPQYRISIGAMTTSGNASVMRVESSAGDQYHVIAIEEADTLLSVIESVFK
ncbi:MAG: hypothetical protein NTX50_14585, partial [Candidatus Sumerlaeota bacterium]|nr:hypothetical protein [Candidatus Sumerlaeota bacterium]